MNILFITGMLPYPLNNGRNIRAYNLIRRLSEKNNLTLFITEEKNAAAQSINEMKKFCKEVRVIPFRPLSKTRLFFRFTLSLFRKEPFSLLKRFSKNVKQEIDFLLKNESMDIVICDRLTETLYMLNERIKAIKVYSTHNIEHLIVRRFSESTANLFKKILSSVEWKKIASYEKRVWKYFDFSIAVSDNDKKIISNSVSGERVFVVPNGIDTEYLKPTTKTKLPLSIIYTGQMGWFPNEDAVTYFTDAMYPSIKKEIPNLEFYIVGSNTSEKVKKLGAGDDSIKITGRVDDMREYIDKASVYIVPLRMGSGTRIKILEAFAMAKPVVSTSIGCEGLEVADGENIMIADEPAKFANKVVSLLKDEAASRRLGEAGRRLVKEKYDWNVVFNQLDKLVYRIEGSTGSGR